MNITSSRAGQKQNTIRNFVDVPYAFESATCDELVPEIRVTGQNPRKQWRLDRARANRVDTDLRASIFVGYEKQLISNSISICRNFLIVELTRSFGYTNGRKLGGIVLNLPRRRYDAGDRAHIYNSAATNRASPIVALNYHRILFKHDFNSCFGVVKNTLRVGVLNVIVEVESIISDETPGGVDLRTN